MPGLGFAYAFLSHAEAQRRKGRREEGDRTKEIFQAIAFVVKVQLGDHFSIKSKRSLFCLTSRRKDAMEEEKRAIVY